MQYLIPTIVLSYLWDGQRWTSFILLENIGPELAAKLSNEVLRPPSSTDEQDCEDFEGLRHSSRDRQASEDDFLFRAHVRRIQLAIKRLGAANGSIEVVRMHEIMEMFPNGKFQVVARLEIGKQDPKFRITK